MKAKTWLQLHFVPVWAGALLIKSFGWFKTSPSNIFLFFKFPKNSIVPLYHVEKLQEVKLLVSWSKNFFHWNSYRPKFNPDGEPWIGPKVLKNWWMFQLQITLVGNYARLCKILGNFWTQWKNVIKSKTWSSFCWS